jgi:hypothetical protein
MVDRVEEGNRLPAVLARIPLLAHLKAQHQVQVGKPSLAAALACQSDRARAARAAADVISKQAKALRPEVAAPQRMAVIGIVTRRREARLVHIDAVHAQFANRLFGKARVLVPPERRAHAHRRARLLGEDVVDLGDDFSVWTFDRISLGRFFEPALGRHAPEALIHVDHGPDVLAVGNGQGGLHRLGAFAGREVLWKAGVVGAAVPPVPEDRHRQSEPFLESDRRRQHVRRATAVPDPNAGIEHPVRHEALLQPAFAGPDLA